MTSYCDYLIFKTFFVACRADGGHLASIRNIYEQSFIYSIFFANEMDDGHLSSSDMCWIGLSDFEQPGRFVWTDTSVMTYDNWGPNQPDLPTGGCVQFSFADSYWYDVDCTQTVKAVCRIPISELRCSPCNPEIGLKCM